MQTSWMFSIRMHLFRAKSNDAAMSISTWMVAFYSRDVYAEEPVSTDRERSIHYWNKCDPFSIADPIACSHHRAPDYFRESIQSNRGFYGWPCASYINYLLGFCPRTDKIEVLAGEDCSTSTVGMFMITTNSESPYATGQWTDAAAAAAAAATKTTGSASFRSPAADPFQQQIDQWGKLDGTFNNIDNTNKRFGSSRFDAITPLYDQHMINHLESTTIDDLRTPSDHWRINNKFIQSDNYFMQYRYNLSQGIISDDNFQIPSVEV